MHTRLYWGNLMEEDHVEYPGVDGGIILKWTLERLDGSIDWIAQAQNKDMWRAFVNAVMNLRVP